MGKIFGVLLQWPKEDDCNASKSFCFLISLFVSPFVSIAGFVTLVTTKPVQLNGYMLSQTIPYNPLFSVRKCRKFWRSDKHEFKPDLQCRGSEMSKTELRWCVFQS